MSPPVFLQCDGSLVLSDFLFLFYSLFSSLVASPLSLKSLGGSLLLEVFQHSIQVVIILIRWRRFFNGQPSRTVKYKKQSKVSELVSGQICDACSVPGIISLVPRDRVPFGQHKGSERALGTSLQFTQKRNQETK